MPRPLLLLLGDSLTEFGSDAQQDGWVCLLLNQFNRAADIAQRGMGGYTTQWFMDLVIPTLVDDLQTALHPHLITLWLGANDAALTDGPSHDQHVPLEQYKAHLHAMIATFKTHAPQSSLLLITPPPVNEDERRRLSGGPLDRSNAAASEYARACIQVGEATGVTVLDLHTQFMSLLPDHQWKTLLVDGLHLSRDGNHLMAQLLTNTIQTQFPVLSEKLAHVEFPLWQHSPVPSSNSLPQAMLFATDDPIKLRTGASNFESGHLGVGLPYLAIGLACGLIIAALAGRVRRKMHTWRRSSRARQHEGVGLLVK